MKYDTFKFIYPPRAESKIGYTQLEQYDNGEYVAQVKYNGSCCNVFLIPGESVRVINRHNEPKTRVDKSIDFASLMQEKPMVLSGELMDKSKKGEDGKPIVGFIIWDAIVYNGKMLIDSTFEERLDLLESLFPTVRSAVTSKGLESYDHLSLTAYTGIYKAPTYLNGFSELYEDVIKTDAYEGLLIKKRSAKLQYGFNEKNNSGWQLKVRKPTKIYRQ